MSKTCGTCIHWHTKEKQIPPSGVVLLAAKEEPLRGDCRCSPPSVSISMVQQMAISIYPDLPETFPACSQHRIPIDTGACIS